MEHDLFGKPVSILGSSPRTGFFRIMLWGESAPRLNGRKFIAGTRQRLAGDAAVILHLHNERAG
jgi:hypothetical protein